MDMRQRAIPDVEDKWTLLEEKEELEADTYFLLIAQAVSVRANCTRRKIGAVIVDCDGRIVEAACNSAPEGHPQCLDGACPRGKKSVREQPEYAPYDDCISVHAEARAIIQGDYGRMRGGTMYVTANPCGDCAKLIHGAGIRRLVTPTHIAVMIEDEDE